MNSDNWDDLAVYFSAISRTAFFVRVAFLFVIAINLHFNTAQNVLAQADVTPPTESSNLLDQQAFHEDDQDNVLVSPDYNNESTNIAFYALCPTIACPNDGTADHPKFVFFAENQGHGDLPLSDYWSPDSSFKDIIVVEYINDEKQFTCSDLSLDDCTADPHFISKFDFQVVDNDQPLPVVIREPIAVPEVIPEVIPEATPEIIPESVPEVPVSIDVIDDGITPVEELLPEAPSVPVADLLPVEPTSEPVDSTFSEPLVPPAVDPVPALEPVIPEDGGDLLSMISI